MELTHLLPVEGQPTNGHTWVYFLLVKCLILTMPFLLQPPRTTGRNTADHNLINTALTSSHPDLLIPALQPGNQKSNTRYASVC